MKKYRCKICGFIYDDVKEKVKFEDLPEDWVCPLCGAPKSMFEEVIEEERMVEVKVEKTEIEDLQALTTYEKAIICRNLAKACEKEYKEEEKELFLELANSFFTQEKSMESSLSKITASVKKDIGLFDAAMEVANVHEDRGAKRVITWASKTSRVLETILKTYEEKGIDYLKNTKIWVCDICGFVYIGEEPPKACPICKVPSFKILEVK